MFRRVAMGSRPLRPCWPHQQGHHLAIWALGEATLPHPSPAGRAWMFKPRERHRVGEGLWEVSPCPTRMPGRPPGRQRQVSSGGQWPNGKGSSPGSSAAQHWASLQPCLVPLSLSGPSAKRGRGDAHLHPELAHAWLAAAPRTEPRAERPPGGEGGRARRGGSISRGSCDCASGWEGLSRQDDMGQRGHRDGEGRPISQVGRLRPREEERFAQEHGPRSRKGLLPPPSGWQFQSRAGQAGPQPSWPAPS